MDLKMSPQSTDWCWYFNYENEKKKAPELYRLNMTSGSTNLEKPVMKSETVKRESWSTNCLRWLCHNISAIPKSICCFCHSWMLNVATLAARIGKCVSWVNCQCKFTWIFETSSECQVWVLRNVQALDVFWDIWTNGIKVYDTVYFTTADTLNY